MLSSDPQLCPLPDIGFVFVGGRDATAFLHAQLSQRITDLPAGRAPLAGWHDARGRVRALVRVLRHDGGWLLITHRDAAGALLSGLSPYVLRADVTLAEAEQSRWQGVAVVGQADAWLGGRGVTLGAESGAATQAGGLRWLRIGAELVQVLGPADDLRALASELPEGRPELAALAEIRLGLPTVTPQLAGRYVAQMLNLDLLDAVAFDKGCFPGQEVIARARNLGAVKRRLHRFSIALDEAPAVDAQVADESGQWVGEVVRAVAVDGRVELLAVVQLDSLDRPLFLQHAAKTPLTPES